MFENISGSADLKEEYEKALKAKEEAEQRAVFAYNKTKENKAERRVLKDQKVGLIRECDVLSCCIHLLLAHMPSPPLALLPPLQPMLQQQEEAEKFHELLEQRTTLKTNYFLWLLFHIHSDVQQRESALTELEESHQEHQALVAEKEGLLKDAKKDASKARGVTSSKDKLRMKLEGQVDKLQPGVIESTEAIQALKKRLVADEKAVAKIEKEKANHTDKLAELQAEIDEYLEKESELQSEYDELKQSEGRAGSLTEEQEIEYEQIRDAAAVASAAPRRELQTAARALESARAKAAKVAEERKELMGRKEDAERSVSELTQRKNVLEKVSCLFDKCQMIVVVSKSI
jgi:structural maintenance of chromosome 1